eukprot:358352-Chlamydomonas_euryale.AAC.5
MHVLTRGLKHICCTPTSPQIALHVLSKADASTTRILSAAACTSTPAAARTAAASRTGLRAESDSGLSRPPPAPTLGDVAAPAREATMALPAEGRGLPRADAAPAAFAARAADSASWSAAMAAPTAAVSTAAGSAPFVGDSTAPSAICTSGCRRRHDGRTDSCVAANGGTHLGKGKG